MDNPTFEEDSETLKADHKEPEVKGYDVENIKMDGTDPIQEVVEQSPGDPHGGEIKTLAMKGPQSEEMGNRQKATEEPADEPDGGKKKDLPVKDPQKKRISFNLLGSSGASDDSIEENVQPKQLEREQPGEDPALRNKVKSVKWGNGSEDDSSTFNKSKRAEFTMSMASIYSTASSISLDPTEAGYKTLAGFVVLKILFWDIGSSLGDTVTDFLQGFNLIFDLMAEEWWKPRDDTKVYGIIVLLINWVPGIVAIIHIISHYRREYFALPNTGTSNATLLQRRKRNFVIVVFLCFFLYPLVPTIGYFIVLWNINNNSDSNRIHLSRMELFARTSHSISGCVEAPLQLIMTFYLIFIGLLDNPLRVSMYTAEVNDRFGNMILPSASIPFWTMSFSILNIIGSAIQVNIFNVYIGQIRNMHGFKKYINLTFGHFPFFFHSIIFRVLALSFFLVYLDFKAFIPIFLILFCNLVIGYLTSAEHKLHRDVRRELRKVKKKAKEVEDHPTLQAKGGGGSKSNTSIWLNSLLGICVPTCFVQDVEPVLLLDMEEKMQQEIFKSQKNYQRKVLRYQIQSSVTIILFTLLITFSLVNFTEFGYSPNRFNNMEFNIICSVILAMGLTTFLFVREIDVYEAFKMNEDPALIEDYLVSVKIPQNEDETDTKIVKIEVPDDAEVSVQKAIRIQKRYGTPKKVLTTILVTVLTMAPLIAGYFVASSLSYPSTYILAKKEDSSGLTITAVKSKLLNMPAKADKYQGEVKFCTENSNPFECSNSPLTDIIFVVDLSLPNCVKEMEKSIEKGELGCLPYKGLVLLENWQHRSSSPYPIEVPSDVTEFPIVSVNSGDTTNNKTDIFDKSSTYTIDITMAEYQDILTDEESELYGTKCEKKCLHMFKAKDNYLGCKGVPKRDISITLDCYDKGKTCSELVTFRKVLEKDNPFKNCFNQEGIELVEDHIEYPRPTCHTPNKMWLPSYTCTDSNEERNFDWKRIEHGTSCLDEQGYIITHSQAAPSANCDCRWGHWSNWDEKCNALTDKHRERYQLCKDKKCVLIRREYLVKNSTTGDCTSMLPGLETCQFSVP